MQRPRARLAGIASLDDATEVGAATRLAQNNMLTEIPGALFGLITLAYIVGSFSRSRTESTTASPTLAPQPAGTAPGKHESMRRARRCATRWPAHPPRAAQ